MTIRPVIGTGRILTAQNGRKQVTVYRLICKGTVEEKIVKRASQKNTVQQLVMTGGHSSQGDVLEAEEVVSLLLDDAELEARMKEQVTKQAVSSLIFDP